MSEELDALLGEIKAGNEAPVYLVVGDEFLVSKATEAIVKALVPAPAMGLNLSVLDGVSPRDVAQDLATLPLFPGRKVVHVREPEFLAPRKGRGDPLHKAREAWKAGRRKEGARRLLALAARAGWGADAIDPSVSGAPSVEQWREELGVELADADVSFLKEVAAFCAEEKISAPESDAGPLVNLLQSGLPKGQVLVIGTSEVDAKHPLVALAKKQGQVVERKVAAKLKEVDLSDVVADVLGPLKKRLGRGAAEALKDRLGGNMRLLQSELEKLAAYVEGGVIEASDVEQLVHRAREEEYLELADALGQRSFKKVLRYIDDALEQGTHALPLLGSIAGIVRGLLENHERLAALGPAGLPRSFDQFKSRVFPAIEKEAQDAGRKPPHPYAAFLGMQNAGRYQRAELLNLLVACAEADLGLKSSTDGRLVLERLLWHLEPGAKAGAPVRFG